MASAVDTASVAITAEVELPQTLVDAHADGELVLFVGAGASVGPPSSLPLFEDLARQLADLARVPAPADGVALDYFLGSMPVDFDVKEHAKNLICRPDSIPNSTHEAIVELADSGGGSTRIVTTNFDDHLMSAAAASGRTGIERWIGPALPLGDAFAGVVHLHGSVTRAAEELVLTDKDFGRAYLTHAWATRFLLPMFQSSTVLFVGYSHDDPIMRYLALGLPSGTLRYALTSVPDAASEKWKRLGIEAIGYPTPSGDHSHLVLVLETWRARAQMGRVEHEERMRETVEAGTNLTPVARDYLLWRLGDPSGAQDFVKAAALAAPSDRLRWLRWLEGLPSFQALFAGGERTEASMILAAWFCNSVIADPTLSNAAFQTVQRLGQQFDPALLRAASWATHQLRSHDVVAARRWRAFLTTSIRGGGVPMDYGMLLAHPREEDPEHVAVLRSALQPYLRLKQRFFIRELEAEGELPDAEIRLNLEWEGLSEHLKGAVECAPAADSVLGAMLENGLAAAQDLLDIYRGGSSSNELSHRRSAIEAHKQNNRRDPLDAVIDAVREYGLKALSADPGLKERWWSLGRPMFKRLALHLLAHDESLTSDQKLEWLLDNSLLYEFELKHETYSVLSGAVLDASDSVRERLLAAALAGPSVPEADQDQERDTSYLVYNLLIWLTQSDSEWAQAAAALVEIQEANPSFAPREHPDLDSWISDVRWGGRVLMAPEDFISQFETDPTGAIDGILSRDYSDWQKPQWHDARALIASVAGMRPEVGLAIWERLEAEDDHVELALDLERAIVDGWAPSELARHSGQVLLRVASLADDAESVASISAFLIRQLRNSREADEVPGLEAMRQIAIDLWNRYHGAFEFAVDGDPLGSFPLFRNSWPGDLAEFWVSEVAHRWQRNRDQWSGLDNAERSALTDLINAEGAVRLATIPAVAAEVLFLFNADIDFAADHLLPLFRSDATSRLSWYPYLHNPQWSEKLLARGFLDSMIIEWGRLSELGDDDLRHQFQGLTAAVLSYASVTDKDRIELLDRSVLAEDGAYAAEFAWAVAYFVSGDAIDGAEVWRRWLGSHLKQRLAGLPRTAQPEEMRHWADAVPYLGECGAEAIELLEGHQVGFSSDFFRPPPSPEVLRTSPASIVAFFAKRVDDASDADWELGYRVSALVVAVRNALGEEIARPLVEAAEAKGYLDFAGD